MYIKSVQTVSKNCLNIMFFYVKIRRGNSKIVWEGLLFWSVNAQKDKKGSRRVNISTWEVGKIAKAYERGRKT